MSIELSNWPGAEPVTSLQDSKRPAWLWDASGSELLWRNDAARLFAAKYKKHKFRLPKPAVPIKGQVRRLLRLGSPGVPSLARVRFLVGSKPVSATCQCTPLEMENGETGLLIVGADEVDGRLFRHLKRSETKKNGNAKKPHDPDARSLNADAGQRDMRAAPAAPPAPPPSGPDASPERETPDRGERGEERSGQLSELLGQLSAKPSLFEPVDERDEAYDVAELTHRLAEEQAGTQGHATGSEVHKEESTGPDDTQEEEAGPGEASGETTEQWRVTGRGFRADVRGDIKKEDDGREEPGEPRKPAEPQTDPRDVRTPDTSSPVAPTPSAAVSSTGPGEMDRAARYNFDELSRILSEKVGRDKRIQSLKSRSQGQRSSKEGAGKTINLSEEVLVLNRLPVGILIFRDQDILFANRALADLVGAPSISQLKARGLAAIFPQTDTQEGTFGPVVNIIGADGEEIGIDARLQSITWQESPALMLSAQRKSTGNTGEGENSKTFVQALARSRNEGYLELDRSGRITRISQAGARMLEQPGEKLTGRPLSEFLDAEAGKKLRAFLERDARTAQSMLPYIELAARGGQVLEIYTQGHAGLVQGYFGTIALPPQTDKTSGPGQKTERADDGFLSRLSRGIRRPLNTILGFSELIGSQAFGKIENQRYVDYARNIESAGEEIAQLTDELDEYTQLKDKNYTPLQTSFDLAKLLDECMSLVRGQANRRQVFVRSAISENLPFIRADRASLRQAILNLLASAIVQTPAGGKVILSAQVEDDGSVGIHVRDSSSGPTGVADRFVVFREQDKRGGEAMVAMKSSMGLALTRSLVAVNSCALHVDPSAGAGTLMSVVVPPDLLERGD